MISSNNAPPTPLIFFPLLRKNGEKGRKTVSPILYSASQPPLVRILVHMRGRERGRKPVDALTMQLHPTKKLEKQEDKRGRFGGSM